MLALLYMAGLVAFQRYTGLLHTPNYSLNKPIHSSEEALHWLRHFQDGVGSPHSRLIRSLMALPEDSENGTLLNSNSTNSTNTTIFEEAEQSDPLFPPDLFTMEQIKSGYVIFYIIGKLYASRTFDIGIFCFRSRFKAKIPL